MRLACIRRTLLAALTFAATGLAGAAPPCMLEPFDVWHVWLEQNKVLVEGAINGKRVSAILDTGAQRTVILRPAAKRLGLRTRLTPYSMGGVDGKVTVDVTTIDAVRIGTATRRNWRMLVVGEQDFGDDVAIILGDDFFQHADIEFDLPHRVVRMFHPAPECAGESLAYWGAASVVSMGPVQRRPRTLVPVTINDKAFWAVLDSGAVVTQLDVTTAAAVGVTPDTPGVGVAGTTSGLRASETITWLGAFDSFAIGDESVARPTLLFGELGLSHSLLLGADFLLTHRVLIAHSQRKVYFSPVAVTTPDAILAPSGAATPGATLVPSGPAIDAGPKGDAGAGEVR